MKIDIRRYLSLRDSLLKEKDELQARLQQINEALGEASAATARSAATPPSAVPRRGGRRGNRSGTPSLREAVLQVASGESLTKQEILDRVRALGYRFSTNNPMNSLGVILYGKNPRFKNQNGRFSLSGSAKSGSAGGSSAASAISQGAPRKRRTMSPEAKARIAAAQKARWAKARAAKSK